MIINRLAKYKGMHNWQVGASISSCEGGEWRHEVYVDWTGQIMMAWVRAPEALQARFDV